MTRKGTVRAAGITHPGKVRPLNEDAIHVEAQSGMAVVTDGMGGHNAGDIASAMAVRRIVQELHAGLGNGAPAAAADATAYSAETLLLNDAVCAANAEIFRVAADDAGRRGMGTTVVAALFRDGRISIAHVGDSRLYRFRDDVLEQLTVDHSLQADLARRSGATAGAVQASVGRNVITRALGMEETVTADLQEEPVLAGDVYLLCSDGLTTMVSDEQITATLIRFGGKITPAARELVAIANRNGGHDNISVVLVYINKSFAQQSHGSQDEIEWFD